MQIIAYFLCNSRKMLYICGMKVIQKTYKFRLYPNKEQEKMLANYFGSVRFVYNHFLAKRKEQYEQTRKSSNYYEQAKELTAMKKTEAFSWLKEINSQTLQHALRHLETAYVNFFKGRTRFPRFHSKKHGGSFAVPQHFKVEGNRIFIPKFKGGIRFAKSQDVLGELRNMTVSVTPGGKYYVCIMAHVEVGDLEKTNLSVGIDLGLKDFVITSNGDRYSSNKFIKKYSKKLATMQKHLSRKKKGSGSWNRQRIKVARLQEKITSCRNDKLHKISVELIRRYDVVCCEDLNVKGMVKNHHLAKAVSDASWGTFVTMLEYKAKWYGKELVKIGRFYPSSKTCHHCGHVKEDLSLEDRYYTCPNCGELIDRDLNAAKNILDEGLRNISAGTVDYTDGEGVRLACKHSLKKSESRKS